MPMYCFRADDGEVFERMFSMSNVPAQIHEGGKIAKRSLVTELSSQGSPPTKGWPMTCVASGVNADQASELSDHLAKKGVPTEVTSDGDPIYRNAAHRRKALKARGIIDRNSFV